jgi:hypothetical protein
MPWEALVMPAGPPPSPIRPPACTFAGTAALTAAPETSAVAEAFTAESKAPPRTEPCAGANGFPTPFAGPDGVYEEFWLNVRQGQQKVTIATNIAAEPNGLRTIDRTENTFLVKITDF